MDFGNQVTAGDPISHHSSVDNVLVHLAAAIFDPVECGDNKCYYSSGCLAMLAGFQPTDCIEEGTIVPTEADTMLLPTETQSPTDVDIVDEEAETMPPNEEEMAAETQTPIDVDVVDEPDDMDEDAETITPTEAEILENVETESPTADGTIAGTEIENASVPPAPDDLDSTCHPAVLVTDVARGDFILQCQQQCLVAECCWNPNNPVACPEDKNCAAYIVPCGTNLLVALKTLDEAVLSDAECSEASPCGNCEGDCNSDLEVSESPMVNECSTE